MSDETSDVSETPKKRSVLKIVLVVLLALILLGGAVIVAASVLPLVAEKFEEKKS